LGRSGSRIPPFEKAETANYVIFKEDGVTKAKNGKDGSIDFSSSDASTVIQNTIDALTGGGIVYVKQPSTPYRTSKWIDIDTSNVSLIFQSQFAEDGTPIIKVADGANVGGLRVGYNSHCEKIYIKNFGYHGNTNNQDPDVKYLHAIHTYDVKDIVITDFYLTRTHPYHEHNTGGSGITCTENTYNIWMMNGEIYDIGDRGIQSGATRNWVLFNNIHDGFDRGICFDAHYAGGTWTAGPVAFVIGNRVVNSSAGTEIKSTNWPYYSVLAYNYVTGKGIAPSNSENVVTVGNILEYCSLFLYGELRNHIISNNLIVGGGLYINSKLYNIKVTNNYIKDGSGIVIGFNNDNMADRPEKLISDNFIINCSYGIRFTGTHSDYGGLTRYVIKNNVILDADNQAIHSEQNGFLEETVIKDNFIKNANTSGSADVDSIFMKEFKDCIIEGNIIKGSNVTRKHIYENSESSGNRIVHNTLEDIIDPITSNGLNTTLMRNSPRYTLASGTVTHTSGSSTRVNGVASDELAEIQAIIKPSSSGQVAADYAIDWYFEWDDSAGNWDLVLTWITDPGSDMDFDYKVVYV